MRMHDVPHMDRRRPLPQPVTQASAGRQLQAALALPGSVMPSVRTDTAAKGWWRKRHRVPPALTATPREQVAGHGTSNAWMMHEMAAGLVAKAARSAAHPAATPPFRPLPSECLGPPSMQGRRAFDALGAACTGRHTAPATAGCRLPPVHGSIAKTRAHALSRAPRAFTVQPLTRLGLASPPKEVTGDRSRTV